MAHLSIAKIPLSLMIAFSALFGFVIQKAGLSPESLACFTVVFLLSAGCATLNNIQDINSDSTLQRTRQRPLPTGKINPNIALLQSGILLTVGLIGLILLAKDNSKLPFYGGIISIILYNGIYTPLKKQNVLAIIPGAICGMMAPLLGCLLAGGNIFGPINITALWIIGLWQFPHFWLILLCHRHDYQKSDVLPSMLTMISEVQLRRIILTWVLSFATITLFLPFLGVVTSPFGTISLTINAIILACYFAYRCLAPSQISQKLSRHLFIHLNLALFLVITLGVISNS